MFEVKLRCFLFKVSVSIVEVVIVVRSLELRNVLLGPGDTRGFRLSGSLLRVHGVEFLSELFELVEVVCGHRATRGVEGLLEMGAGDHGNGILHIFLHVCVLASLCSSAPALFLCSDGVTDRSLSRPLTQLGDISTGKVLGQIGAEVKWYVGGDGRLSQHCHENVFAGWLVGQGDVDQLIETTGSDQGFIEDVGSVGSPDEEKVLLDASTVHLGQKLVKNTVTGTASITATSARSGGTDGVELVEEEDARCGTSCLVEDATNVGLGLSEPHGKELGSLHRDKV